MTTLSCKNPAASASYFDAVTPNNYFQNHSSLQQVSITKSDSNGIETTKSVQVTSWRSSPPRSLREKTTCLKKRKSQGGHQNLLLRSNLAGYEYRKLPGHFVTWFMTKRRTESHLIPRWNRKLVCLKKCLSSRLKSRIDRMRNTFSFKVLFITAERPKGASSNIIRI